MITDTQALEILTRHRLQLIPILDIPSGVVGWLTRTIDGTRAGGKHNPFSTPNEAVENADAYFTLAEKNNQEKLAIERVERLTRLLESGVYIKPKDVKSGKDPIDGSDIVIRVYDVIDSTGKVIANKPSVLDAAVEGELVLRKNNPK